MNSSLVYGTSTTSKRSLWPTERADLWVLDAQDAQLKLSNGRWYDDWASALGAQTLGYSYFGDHLFQFQPATSLPWRIEQQFAEQFCAAMGTEAVRFFKSGSDAVSCAVRLARAFTGRDTVVVFMECYHGTGDWHGWNLWSNKGTISDHSLVRASFGTSFYEEEMDDRVFTLDETAAIVLEPVPKSIIVPPTEWLEHLRETCDAHGIILISDEVILGFRDTLSGYMRSAGVRADLSCYGKAMGQGCAVSACTGRADIMDLLARDVHFSGTNNGEPLPLALASKVLSTYKQSNVCEQLVERGLFLQDMLHTAGFQTRGLPGRFEVLLCDRMSATKFLWDKGILFPGFCSMSLAHTNKQMKHLAASLQLWQDQL